jgi:hypothetical protein
MSISKQVWALLDGPTVSAELAKDPTASPGKIAERLFNKQAVKHIEREKEDEGKVIASGGADDEAYTKYNKKAPLGLPPDDSLELKDLMDRAASTGKFPYRPSDLFLKVCFVCVLCAFS